MACILRGGRIQRIVMLLAAYRGAVAVRGSIVLSIASSISLMRLLRHGPSETDERAKERAARCATDADWRWVSGSVNG